MPSFLHEAIVEILRANPALVIQLLPQPKRSLLPPFDTIVPDSSDLGAALAPELSADCLLRVEREGQTVFV